MVTSYASSPDLVVYKAWLFAACDCGTPWTFLLTFLIRYFAYRKHDEIIKSSNNSEINLYIYFYIQKQEIYSTHYILNININLIKQKS